MTTFLTDLRYGVRLLYKSPLLSSVSVLTMALGIGLTVFTFAMVYGSVFRGLPLPDDERLISVAVANPERGIRQTVSAYADLEDYRDQAGSFEFLGTVDWFTVNLASEGDPPARYQGAVVSANVLSNLGVPPLLGRTFRDGEDLPGSQPKLVLSHHVWEQRFDSDESVIGRGVRANGEQAEIIGVMPAGFKFPFSHDMWMNRRADPDISPRRARLAEIIGRVREGVSFEAATAELRAIQQGIEARHPEEGTGYLPQVQLFENRYMPAEITAVMYVMLAAVFGVLLIACANVANLLLARAALRSREVAVRTALGASRMRVVRQLLAETGVLALAGGLLGVVLAKVLGDAWWGTVADIEKPYWIGFEIETMSLLFAGAVVAATALLAGTIPALRATGGGMANVLRDENRGGTSFRLGRLSSMLVIGEVAISCALLIAAGLMIKSIVAVTSVDLGYGSEGIVSARVALFEADYPERADREQFFASLIERIREEPGVEAAALTTSLPGIDADIWAIGIEGEPYDTEAAHPRVTGTIVGTEFFSTFGIDVRQGREFNASEMGGGAEPVAIVNESFRQRYFDDRPALGSRVQIGTTGSTNPWMRIVGIVPDIHVTGGIGGIGSDTLPREQLFVSQGVFDVDSLTFAVRSSLPTDAVVPRLRAAVTALDPNLPIYDVRTVSEAIEEHTWAFVMFGRLFSMLGFAALFLAGVGLYGVMAFSVSSRQRELGVRMALGARASDVLALIARKGATQLGIGLTIGLGLGYLLGRPMRFVTYGVEASDPVVYLAIVATLVAAGTLATLMPARRATRVDPATALRND